MGVTCVYYSPSGLKVEECSGILSEYEDVKLRKLRREIASSAVQSPSKTTAALLSDIDSFYEYGRLRASLANLIFSAEQTDEGFYIFKADDTHWSIRYYSNRDSEYMQGGQPTNKLLLRMERDKKRAEKAFQYEESNA